jgi:hypothetical protein
VLGVRRPLSCLTWIALVGASSLAGAQFRDEDPGGAKLGDARVQRWKAGLVVTAAGGPCRGLVGYVPVPSDWPEQEVQIVDEEFPPQARVSYQTVDDTVKIMVVRIPMLQSGQVAEATVTYEVRRSTILPPDDTDQYVLPDVDKLDRKVRIYLTPSPMIESRDPRVRRLAKEIGVEKEKAWERVEAIYDWVREEVEYKNGPLKGAVKALQDKTGDCEELTSLFIAICRAAGIPARTVWVQGHCYPEFYLLDAAGEGHWFPCQAAGTRSFGGIPEYRPVLSKGDNFRMPYDRRDRKRYPAEHLTGTGGSPRVRWVRQLASE